MGSDHNRMRHKWQDYSGQKAAVAEHSFFNSFDQVFDGTDYSIRPKPKEFQKIYINIALSEEEIKEIYNPPETISRHGVLPDYAIDNKRWSYFVGQICGGAKLCDVV